MAQDLTSATDGTVADRELSRMLSVTRRLPKFKPLRLIAKWLRRRYLRQPRAMLVADVLDFKMCLNPMEYIDGSILFAPQLYDPREISFLQRHLKRGDVFLDVGSHIGFYALTASRLVGPEGVVIAIEADPATFGRLQRNVELNDMPNVRCLNLGVSDKRETLRLGVSTSNQGANSFLNPGFTEGVDVPCQPLLEVLQEQQIRAVAAAKFDIEGFEHRVLSRFFADADAALYPQCLVIELNWKYYPEEAGQAMELLRSKGYQARRASKSNYLMELA